MEGGKGREGGVCGAVVSKEEREERGVVMEWEEWMDLFGWTWGREVLLCSRTSFFPAVEWSAVCNRLSHA